MLDNNQYGSNSKLNVIHFPAKMQIRDDDAKNTQHT